MPLANWKKARIECMEHCAYHETVTGKKDAITKMLTHRAETDHREYVMHLPYRVLK